MTFCPVSRRVAGRSAAMGSRTAVVTLRHGSAEQSGGLAWSHNGHIRSCDLAAANGIQCQLEVKKAGPTSVDAAGCHLTVRQESDYGSGGRGFESLPARSKPQNSGVVVLACSHVGHEGAAEGTHGIQSSDSPLSLYVAEAANRPPPFRGLGGWDSSHPRRP